jgi:aspartate 1-decarboxylase
MGIYIFAPIMTIQVLKSKIHRARITQAELHYVGSITLDPDLMDAANMIEGEKVQVLNINNGERLETYVITGKRGSGEVCINGPAARKMHVGDMDFEKAKTFKPWLCFPDAENRPVKS